MSGARSYTERLAAMVPAEAIAIYTGLYGVVGEAAGLSKDEALYLGWSIFGLSLLVTIAYLIFQKLRTPNGRRWGEIPVVAFSFVIWAFAVGGILRETTEWWKPVYERVILVAWTMIPPLFLGMEQTSPTPPGPGG